MRKITGPQTILNAKAATGIGTWVEVSENDVIILDLRSANSANLTVKAVASIAEVIPDPTAAATPANPWDFVALNPINGGSQLGGATGLALSGTDGGGIYLINCAGIKWLTLYVTARSAGSVSGFIRGFSTGGGQ